MYNLRKAINIRLPASVSPYASQTVSHTHTEISTRDQRKRKKECSAIVASKHSAATAFLDVYFPPLFCRLLLEVGIFSAGCTAKMEDTGMQSEHQKGIWVLQMRETTVGESDARSRLSLDRRTYEHWFGH